MLEKFYLVLYSIVLLLDIITYALSTLFYLRVMHLKTFLFFLCSVNVLYFFSSLNVIYLVSMSFFKEMIILSESFNV